VPAILELMADDDDPIVTTRVPREWLARADALAEVLTQVEEVRVFGRPSRSTVVRMALLRGLEMLEKTYGTATSPKPTSPAKKKATKR
jgi:hypothetical protein